MRKTRRGKWWVAAALTCFLGGYTAGVWPRISQHNYSAGWLGAVPTPVLILTLPALSAEPGSVPERGTPATAIPYPQRPLAERVAQQIKTRLYKSEQTSAIDRWIFERIARRHSWRTLTDETSVRGQVFTYVYRALARQHRLGTDEAQWAGSVYWMDVDTPDALPQMSPVYVRVNEFRRLLSEGSWRVQIEDTLFEPVRRHPDFITRLRPVGGVNELRDGYVRISDFVRWANFMSLAPDEDLPIRGRIYEGEPSVDMWWPVGVIKDSARVTLLPVEQSVDRVSMGRVWGVEFVEDESTIAWLNSAIEGHIRWGRSTFFGEPTELEGVQLSVRDGMLGTDIPGFTFGGSISIEIEFDHAGPFAMGARGPERSPSITGPTWWALRDDRDEAGERVFDGHRMFVPLQPGGQEALSYLRCCDGHSTITSAWIVIQAEAVAGGESYYAPLWDLDAQRVYPFVLRIPLQATDKRTLEHVLRVKSGLMQADP